MIRNAFLRTITLLAFSWASQLYADEELLRVFKSDVRPVLKSLCYSCHGADKESGGIRFDQLDPDVIAGPDVETWHDALDQLNGGEMPPRKATQPTEKQRQLLTDWLRMALRRAAEAKRYRDGRVVTRRLTKYEYANTMRDLLGVDLKFARDLPPDPAAADGFQNNGATLEMSSTQIESYLRAARTALAEAIVTGPRPELHEYSQTATATGRLPVRKVAGHEPVRPEFVLDLKKFPRHGEFELRVTARAAIPDGMGLPKLRISMGHVPGIIHVPRGEIGETDVSEDLETFVFKGRMEDFPQPGPIAFGNSGFKGMIVMIDFLDADGNELRYPDRTYPQPPPKPKKKKPKGKAKAKTETRVNPQPVPFGERLEIEITSAEFRAPIYASWPPPSHERLLFATENSDDETSRVRELLQPFMTSAFRRPVEEEELRQMTSLFESLRPKTESFEEAVRETFAAVLVSPHFLYIVERLNPDSKDRRVTDHELASRLSYFLWSSAPDATLLDLAKQGRLREPATLRRQAKRLMADPRSTEFVQRFVDQWLDLDGLDRVAVNPEFYPDFDNALKDAMRQETQAYFARVLHEDRSALELLESDWAMLNRPLANHYGLDGPRSSQFKRVTLDSTGSRPGGLLGQGAFLLANSNGEDSHPIKRAVWILDRLLDSPPASPPADVPELDPESAELAKLTLKQQLAVHRKKESCANCHRGIDPWGVPLENFDAVGRWREKVTAQKRRPASPVDASSELPDGKTIQGVRQLQRHLVDECAEQFARAVVKRLMAYGLGRSLDFGDREAVEKLTASFVSNDYRLESLIVDFVESDAFQTK